MTTTVPNTGVVGVVGVVRGCLDGRDCGGWWAADSGWWAMGSRHSCGFLVT